MDTTWKPATKYIVGVGLFLLLIYLIYLSWTIINLIIIGALIAFLVRPVILFFNSKLKIPRRLAIIITYLLVVIIVFLAPLILIPPIISSFNFLLSIDYQELINNTLTWLEQSLLDIKANGLQIFSFQIVLNSTIDPVLAYLQNVSPKIAPQLPSYQVILDSLISAFSFSYGVAKSVIGTVFSVVIAFIVIIIASIYFSLDAYRFYKGFLQIIPKAYRAEVSELLGRIGELWYWFLRGEFFLMVIIFFLVWISGTIIGLPGAFPLALIAGALEIIPTVGHLFLSTCNLYF
jgi:predicted PurR-regulated permease PerM